jgi:GNAT superfamily N-acetyltransferase
MRIETVTADTFELILPLIADYQRFYEAEPDQARNRAHFSQFLEHHDKGIQFVALDENGQALGFATLYFPMGSVTPGVYCLMNDLFTIPAARGQGVGRALILHCLDYAKAHGFSRISWQTAQTKERAQRLYNSLPTTYRVWLGYTLPVSEIRD